MLKHVWSLFLLGCFLEALAINPTWANPNMALPKNENIDSSKNECDLPAPDDLIITNVTSNSVTCIWEPVPNAAAYHIEARHTVTNTLYYTNDVVFPNDVCTGLPGASPITIFVWPICENGSASNKSVEANTYTNIIIELVMNGYQSCPNTSNWNTYTAGEPKYTFQFSPYEEMEGWLVNPAQETTHKFNFKTYYDSPTNKWICNLKSNNTLKWCNYTSFDFDKIIFTIAGSSTVVGFIEFAFADNNSSAVEGKVTELTNGYTFKWKKCGAGRPGREASERIGDSKDESQKTKLLEVTPNPFESFLNYTLDSDDDNATIELLNLDGTLIQTVNFTNIDSKSGNLSTSSLAAGAYILRARTSTKSEAQLVIKTE